MYLDLSENEFGYNYEQIYYLCILLGKVKQINRLVLHLNSNDLGKEYYQTEILGKGLKEL